MKKKIIFIIINVFLVLSCVQTKSRQPINSENKSFLSISAYRNIDIQKKEKMTFLKIIEEDSKSKYIISNKGFWFKILKSSKKIMKPKSGDVVEFFYNILDIKGNDIYIDDNLKPVKYVVDKEEIIPALRHGVKELKIGESGIFLMPSFLGYGHQGDGEKIFPNQPLIIQIDLISLKHNTN
tara:strand:+ start:85 stop:627 length:543 start_codon:yes stop_codon:yes gene_type:complete